MKASLYLHTIWAAAAVCVFCVGYSLGDGSSADAGTAALTSPSLPKPVVPSSVQAASSAPARGHAESRKVSPVEEMRVRAFKVAGDRLSRVERMRQLCDLFSQVTPENWRQVLDGFERAPRTKEGGVNENLNLLIEHIGAIAGADALEDALHRANGVDKNRVTTLMRGWVEKDPTASVAWFQAQPEAIQKAYLGHFITGLSRVDPKAALEFTLRSDEAFYQGGTTANVINNGVILLGLKGMEEIFVSMRTRSDIPDGAKNQFFASLANKTLTVSPNTDKPAEEVLDWYQNHVGESYVSAQVSSRIIGQAAKANAQATMSWLGNHGDRLSVAEASAVFSGAASELQRQSPQQFSAWIASNPAHPQRDGMIEAATNSLLQSGDVAGASRMSAMIRNSEARARVAEMVQRRATAPQ
jgi:hypothetical protein